MTDTTKAQEELLDKIYSILYAYSDVDLVRVLYEDRWPLDELADFISAQRQQAAEEATLRERERCLECVVDSEVEVENVTLTNWFNKFTKKYNQFLRDKIKGGM